MVLPFAMAQGSRQGVSTAPVNLKAALIETSLPYFTYIVKLLALL
jgi:hypothetical protein